MYKLLDGRAAAAKVKERIKQEIAHLESCGKRRPCLAVILAGDDPASEIYVKNKRRDCDEVGIISREYDLPRDVTREELLKLIDNLGSDGDVDGILCQLPLPEGLNENEAVAAVLQEKDVDGFNPINAGRLVSGGTMLEPCTPSGIMELLSQNAIDVESKHCVIVGRSEIVGKPMALMMLRANATVTVCHSKTRDLTSFTRQADILISAAGKRDLIDGSMVKPGAVVVDVGINRDENGRLCGDVNFEDTAPRCSYITPVPGGIGPMTRAMLLSNTLKAYRSREKDNG